MGAEKLFEQITILLELDVEIGYFGPEGRKLHPNARIPVAQLAAVHEFGGGGSPERSFLRATMNEKAREIGRELERQQARVLDGQTEAIPAMSEVGRLAARLVRERLQSGAFAPLDEDTERSGKPLDDTGTLAAALRWAVKRGGSVVAEGR